MKFSKVITSSIPFQLSTGNHEAHNNFADYKKRFMMPNKQNTENLYYSYDIKNTHFVSVNSEIPYEKQFTPDYILKFTTWLKNDLLSTKKRWKVIYLHRGLYCSRPKDYHCGSSAVLMRDLYEDIINKAKVDLVISGHVHAYERLFPIFKSRIDITSVQDNDNTYYNPSYPTHVTCGTGGNREGYAIYPPGKLSKKVISTHGFCELEITRKKIDFTFVGGANGKVLDRFKIVKDND